ncbi:MerR family transcriptional regulator [Solitalea canadensis]|uniref:Putative transcriptional regulator n=1 Tax=Solitalea canadensis (strain ATCC 29591 / DSM 3403 / JCM 21819 / LMG 8368 / NBRC 15130 / NCIMB 12057 / USAM 9D) TaxID=929556 RepID=H8KQZ4_SOLCM|nr:MerR family transcriptional regulator [Solitalea canadensis]AFD07140.1 putative transcriptional regulator [Solitalea canadensis DSM 3403]
MPYKDREITKLYYTIGEVAALFNVNTSLIRFWEKEFDILQPKKNKKGNRLFSPEDLENLRIIYHLVKEKGYTLQGAKDYLKGNKNVETDKQKVIESLTSLKSFLLKLGDELKE